MNLTADYLRQLIKTGRTSQVDWFREQVPLDVLAATMAAMTNTQGGIILLGVDIHSGHVIGVHNTTDCADRLLQASLTLDPPLITPVPQIVRVDSKNTVAIQVPQGMPNVYAVNGRYLRRRGAENIPLKTRELRQLILQRSEMSFETEMTSGVSAADLDWDKARAYAASLSGLSERGVEQILVKRGCLVEREGVFKPTNAGMLLFGRDPQRFIRGADITAVRFAGEAMSDTFRRQDITGTLPDQIRRAEVFLVDHLRKEVQLGQTMARAESFEYPMEAARELVVNAVAHRDYHITGDGIRLFIFSNRMEVTSPGGLPGPVTIDNIKDERFSRNPVIVQVLADMGFIERLGYGIDRVIDLMRQQNLADPEFQETGGGVRVVLRNEPIRERVEAKLAVPAVRFNGVYQGLEINPRQEVALSYLYGQDGSQRITNSDLQQLCPDVHPETIRRDLADLVTKNILRKMGQKRGSYYVLNRTDV